MNDEPKPVEPPTNGTDSKIFGVSVRAHLTMMLFATVCISHLISCVIAYLAKEPIVIGEPLYTLVVATAGFYYGQKTLSK